MKDWSHHYYPSCLAPLRCCQHGQPQTPQPKHSLFAEVDLAGVFEQGHKFGQLALVFGGADQTAQGNLLLLTVAEAQHLLPTDRGSDGFDLLGAADQAAVVQRRFTLTVGRFQGGYPAQGCPDENVKGQFLV